MFTNADITIYQFNKENKSYQKIPIFNVFWNDTKQTNVLKTGNENADSVKILIPIASLEEPVSFTVGKDWVAKGIIEYEIDCSNEKLLSQSLSFLKDNFKTVTVTSCDEKRYGSECMQHYKLSCK